MDGLRSTLRILNLLRRTIYCFDILSREVDKGLTKVDRSSSPISTFSSCRQRHPPLLPKMLAAPSPSRIQTTSETTLECRVFPVGFRAIPSHFMSRVFEGVARVRGHHLLQPPPSFSLRLRASEGRFKKDSERWRKVMHGA